MHWFIFILNNFLHTTTAIESIVADACHAVRDGDGCQAATVIKRIIADARHAVGDGDGCQAAATAERNIANYERSLF